MSLLVCSSAQLLEQFRIEHGIRPPSFMSAPGSGGGLGMLSGADAIGGELDKAPGGPTSILHHGLMMQHDYDDPPGLYEKVFVSLLSGIIVLVHNSNSFYILL